MCPVTLAVRIFASTRTQERTYVLIARSSRAHWNHQYKRRHHRSRRAFTSDARWPAAARPRASSLSRNASALSCISNRVGGATPVLHHSLQNTTAARTCRGRRSGRMSKPPSRRVTVPADVRRSAGRRAPSSMAARLFGRPRPTWQTRPTRSVRQFAQAATKSPPACSMPRRLRVDTGYSRQGAAISADLGVRSRRTLPIAPAHADGLAPRVAWLEHQPQHVPHACHGTVRHDMDCRSSLRHNLTLRAAAARPRCRIASPRVTGRDGRGRYPDIVTLAATGRMRSRHIVRP